MALVVTVEPVSELLSVGDAKRHLRVLNSDLDDEIALLIAAARDYCERYTQRTLRAAVTRTFTTGGWWSDTLHVPHPPLLAVSSIAYYDADNASQTLSSANYIVEVDTYGGGRIIWATTATLPTLYDRPDAITVTFTAGYTAATIPPVALQAMKTKLTELFGNTTDNEAKAAKECTDRLLGLVEWPRYA